MEIELVNHSDLQTFYSSNMNMLNTPPKACFFPNFKEWICTKTKREITGEHTLAKWMRIIHEQALGKFLMLCSIITNYWEITQLIFFSVLCLSDKTCAVCTVHACVSTQCQHQHRSLSDCCDEILFLKREKNSLLKIKYHSVKDRY